MDIDARLYSSLSRVYGSLTKTVVEKLYTPSHRLYVRVDTLLTTRDELLDIFRSRGFRVEPDPYVEEALYFIVEGPYKVPVLDKLVIVDKEGAESIMLGANLYAPGVVGFDDFREGEELTVLAPNGEPIAIVKAVVSSDKLKFMNKGVVGVNILSRYRAPPLRDQPEYEKGYFYPQSLPAMITTHILDPKPYELIVDMNAAPGGKTSHIIQLTRGLARVVAFERSVGKALVLTNTLNRLRMNRNVVVLPMDSRYIDVDLNLVGRVDKVLVDPPCTGLGVRPKVYIDKKYEDVLVASRYQIQFLKTASRILKCNGYVVYSTCTITFEENELVSLKAMKEYGLEPIDPGFQPYAERVEYEDLIAVRYSPLGYDMPGYYIVLFKKKC